MQDIIREFNHSLGPDTSEQIAPPVTFPSLNVQGLMFVGLSDAGKQYRMDRPRPDHGHLLVTLSGAGWVWVGGQWVECGEGMAYASPPGAVSAFKTAPDRRWRFAWVFTLPEEQPQSVTFSFFDSQVVPAAAKPLATAIEGIYHEGISDADRSLLNDWAHLIRVYTQRIAQPNPQHRIDPLANLWAEVDARPAGDWSIAKLAKSACMSGETLRKLCVSHHGRSPMEHVTHLRMRRADTLLQSTSSKLIVIARMVGYENVFAFSTAFRRIYGVPPSVRRFNQSPTS